jgi:hypothetical protein
MLSRQPLIQRRRQQKLLTRIETPKRLIHRPAHHPNRLYRHNLEQTLTITSHNS